MKTIQLTVLMVGLSLLVFKADGQPSFLTNGLIAYFPLSGNMNASFGNGYCITNNNGTLTSDRFGASNCAYYFSGANSYAIFAVTNIPLTNSPRTISLWMQSLFVGTRTIDEHIAGYGSFPSDEAFGFFIDHSTSDLDGYLGGAAVLTTYKATNQWVLLTHTFDGTNATVYVDGVLAGQLSVTLATQSNSLFTIGARYATELNGTITNFFKGNISSIRIYNVALSSNQVAQLYSLESTVPSSGIATYSNNPVVFFPTVNGLNYVVQMTTNLNSPVWVTVTNGVPFSGIQITNPPPNAFFRLVQ